MPESDSQCFVVRRDHTAVYDREYGEQQAERTRAWGLKRITTRRRRLECRRALPPVTLSDEKINIGFTELHAEYPDAYGNTCPHRGYDLTSVPIDADGCRRCPIHQLKVRAPRRRPACRARPGRNRGSLRTEDATERPAARTRT